MSSGEKEQTLPTRVKWFKNRMLFTNTRQSWIKVAPMLAVFPMVGEVGIWWVGESRSEGVAVDSAGAWRLGV